MPMESPEPMASASASILRPSVLSVNESKSTMPAWSGGSARVRARARFGLGAGAGPGVRVRVRVQHAHQSLLNLREARAARLRVHLDDARGETGERGGRALTLENRNACNILAGLTAATGAKCARPREVRGVQRGSVRRRRFNMRPIRTSMRTATRPSAWMVWRRTRPFCRGPAAPRHA